MPKLYIADQGEETVYEIFEDEVRLGRGAANDVQLHGGAASKMHAVIRRLQGHWKLIDLESRNGTLVNGVLRNQHWLSDGDALRVGEATVRYAAEGAPEGSPAPVVAVAAKPVPAQPAKPVPAQPAKPVPAAAKPVPAAPKAPPPPPPPPTPTAPASPPATAPAVEEEVLTAPAPAVSRGGRSRAGAARRGRAAGGRGHDGYDDYDDLEDDELPPRRRSSNSSTIVIVGIFGAVAFLVLMFAMFGSGPGINQQVYMKAARMADNGKYEEALKYAENNADPDEEHYFTIVKGMEDWRKLIKARKDAAFETEARDAYDYEIFRRQAVTGRRKGGFRAKDALPEHEVARLLREFLLKYPNTGAAMALIGGEQADYKHLRDCMLENRDASIKSTHVIQGLTAQHDIDVSARRYGDAYRRLDYLRQAYRLIMTSENYTEFRNAVQMKLDDILDTAASKWKDDAKDFDRFLAEGSKAKARKKLGDMKESYGGIPEFAAKLQALEQRV